MRAFGEDDVPNGGRQTFQPWKFVFPRLERFGNLTNRGGGVGGCSDFLPKKCEIATEETANSSEL